jgi:hypothetical protein
LSVRFLLATFLLLYLGVGHTSLHQKWCTVGRNALYKVLCLRISAFCRSSRKYNSDTPGLRSTARGANNDFHVTAKPCQTI